MSEIIIRRGLLDEAGAVARQHISSARAAIVTDSTVNGLYADRLETSLKNAGFDVIKYVFPAGEASKNVDTYINVISFLAENRLTRSDAVFALGGGVVGDLAGFAAATYLRGIKLVQVPTTLLACVDSSVGGKTAVDLPTGKNLLGAFYQPHMVLIDPDNLNTLPESVFLDGAAEVIKYAAIMDAEMYPMFDDMHGRADELIARCVKNKKYIVDQDERDTGLRQLLNFGHTFGHAIELLSDFRLGHGHCVSIGMAIMARACVKKGMCDPICATQLINVLESVGLPTSTGFAADEIYSAMLSDKKRTGGSITLVVPSTPGNCVLHRVPVEEALGFIQAGLN